MAIPGIGIPSTATPPATGVPPSGRLRQKTELIKKIVSHVFKCLGDAFKKSFSFSLKTIPIQIILAAFYPVYGVVLTFTVLHAVTLASLTVGMSVYNLSTRKLPKPAAPPKPPEPEDPKFSGLSILLDSSALHVTRKFYQQLTGRVAPPFTPLSSAQVQNLLRTESSLRNHKVLNNRDYADKYIASIHEQGFPGRLSHSSCLELRDQMRYIIYTISQEGDPAKQKILLKELAVSLEDCVPVNQNLISKRYQELTSDGAFDLQLDHFIALAKEAALDQTINELFPAMQQPGYAKKAPAREQFPHVKTGFLTVYGAEIGLNIKGASEDHNRNESWAHSKRSEFRRVFDKKIEIHNLIKNFIIAINTENNAMICNEDFFIWCGANGLGSESMHDEDAVYPKYFTKPSANQAVGTAAYIDEKTAIEVFKKLGYIQ